MHDRAGGHRGLPTAVGALVGEGFGLKQPGSAPAATRADKPFWPTTLEKVLRACAFLVQSDPGIRSTTAETVAQIQTQQSPCTCETDEQPTPEFLFCTLNLDRPDAHA